MMNMEKRERRAAVRDRRHRAGETLTETLVAMLIVGLSSVLFLTMTGAAGRIYRRAEQEYDVIYEKIARAEGQDSSPSNASIGDGEISVTGSSDTIKVEWYGSTDYVLSYKVK